MAEFVAIGIFTGFLYALIALGYTLVYGILRLINFAHSEVFMTGAFAGYFVLRGYVSFYHAPSGFSSWLWVGAGILTSGAVGALVATLLERFVYRPLRRRNAPRLAYLVAAIGASFFLIYFVGKEVGRFQTSLPLPYTNGTVFTVFGAQISNYNLIVAGVTIVLFVLLDLFVHRTKMGRGIRAVAQDTEMASLMGVNIDRTIALTFAIGGLAGGAAGFLYALNSGVSQFMGFVPALYAFTAAVIGGIGNLRGAMLGGLLLGVGETVPIYWLHQVWLEEPIAFGMLILFLIFRPNGILGEKFARAA